MAALADVIDQAFNHGCEFHTASGVKRILPPQSAMIHFSTGRVVACDPFYGCDAEAFSQPIAPGDYQVEFSLVDEGRMGIPRIAFARLRVINDAAVSYRPAEPSRFGVDMATACFADASTTAIIANFSSPEDEEHFEQLNNALERSPNLWTKYSVGKAGRGEILAFGAGEGDGTYDSYYAHNADGRLVAIVVDLNLLPLPSLDEPPSESRRPWWRFWA